MEGIEKGSKTIEAGGSSKVHGDSKVHGSSEVHGSSKVKVTKYSRRG